jgi:hypothetical protein
MLIAVEHLGSVGVGVTAPQFFRADDGNIYVVKLKDNPLGSRVLASEFLAAKLGEILGLCFPPSSIIEIKEHTLQGKQDLAALETISGRHFASQYLDNTQYVGKNNLYQAVNTSEMAGILLFDHMFHNKDRANNTKNLLLRQEESGYKIYAIDNSHLFRSGRWTLESLNSLSTVITTYYRYSFGLLLKDCLSAQDFIPYLEKVKKLSNQQIDTLVREIPQEWLPDEPERQALARYIKIRRDMVEKIWIELCKQIPNTRGGRRWLYGRVIGSRRKA